MNKKYDTCTKERRELSYDLFIETSLIKLGFVYSNLGTHYYKKLICLIYSRNVNNININNLCTSLEEELKNISSYTISTSIKNAFRRIDKDKASQNFYDIFNVPYDEYFLTPKNLVILFINALNRIYK